MPVSTSKTHTHTLPSQWQLPHTAAALETDVERLVMKTLQNECRNHKMKRNFGKPGSEHILRVVETFEWHIQEDSDTLSLHGRAQFKRDYGIQGEVQLAAA